MGIITRNLPFWFWALLSCVKRALKAAGICPRLNDDVWVEISAGMPLFALKGLKFLPQLHSLSPIFPQIPTQSTVYSHAATSWNSSLTLRMLVGWYWAIKIQDVKSGCSGMNWGEQMFTSSSFSNEVTLGPSFYSHRPTGTEFHT